MSTRTTTPPKASAARRDRIDIRCPADGRVVGSVADTSADEVGAVAQELRLAQPAWEAIGIEGRCRWLGRWRDWILDHQDRLLALLQDEAGKSHGDASIEILASVEDLDRRIAVRLAG